MGCLISDLIACSRLRRSLYGECDTEG